MCRFLEIMDRLQSLEMDAIECAVIVGNETHSYAPKRKEIRALQYDGSLRMSIAIEEVCSKSWVEWDEDGNFYGLYAFSEWGNEHSTSQYVSEGDYLVRTDEGWYMVVDKDDFEREFERMLD